MLFRRNSKEVTSEPTRWHSDHMAVWNQHVGIQTSLLLNKKAMQASSTALEFLKKEYEVVLVAVGPPLVRAPGFRECQCDLLLWLSCDLVRDRHLFSLRVR